MRWSAALKRALPYPGIALAFGLFQIALSQEVRPADPRIQTVASSQDSQSSQTLSRRALLNRYCVTCHNAKLRTGGLALDTPDTENVGKDAAIWEKVVAKLHAGEMPPPGLPRPDPATSAALVSSFETALDHAAQAAPNPGRIPAHRMSRAEYRNAIRDLLALDVDTKSLLIPDDTDQNGFDNIAGALSVSPVLLDRYVAAARKISRLAVGDPDVPAAFDTYEIPKTFVQEDRVSEDLPFGTRGGEAVRHYFPLDGEYVVRIRLRKQLYGYIIGLGRQQQIDVRLDGKRIKLFTIGGDAPGKPVPNTYAADIPADPAWEGYMHSADQRLEVRVPVKAGPHVIGVSFLREFWEPEGVLRPPETDKVLAIDQQYYGKAALESVAIGGPYAATGPGDTPSRRRIFVCRPANAADEQPCAAKILSALARRAYRRPASNDDVRTLLAFYQAGRKRGGFDAGIEFALERMLVDPDFLFRIVRDPANAAPGTIYRLSDVELASRLSFFLWSSIPDDELLDAAVARKLRDPAVLQHEVDRMLADSRSDALIDGFASHWLGLPKLAGDKPDPQVFPEFDDNLRAALEQETRLFLRSQLREDRPVTELLNANYSFLNERLARHYQIPNIHGNQFRKVTFTDGRRGGLLGQGSILMLTSYPNRTSPVLRGKWVLDNLLGTPPPPPPPNIPALKEHSETGKSASMRQLMEEHRNNPACSGCHARMDPIGFSLENFDAIGRWRTRDYGIPIDASGVLPDGVKIDGAAGLKKALLNRPEQFVHTFTEKLLTYALGREVEYYDLPVIRQIDRDAAAGGYRWSSIIKDIVKSPPFQMSIVPNTPPASSASKESE